MERLNPLTAGFDWEMAVLKPGLRQAEDRDIDALAQRVGRLQPATSPGREWKYLEQRSGVMRSFDEALDRATGTLAAGHAAAREMGLRLAPIGILPGTRHVLGCHVHIGCQFSFPARQRLANRFAPYVPAFLALTAHSPSAVGRVGRHKSYRIAWEPWMLGPIAPIPAETAIDGCWGDLCSDRGRKPTLEVRVADSPGCPRLLAEYTALLAGFLAVLAEADEPPATDDLEAVVETVENRAAAIDHGLQATFRLAGRDVDAASLLADILDRAEPGLERFGAAGRLTLIPRMIERRQTQADLLLTRREWYDDPVCFAEACVGLLADPGAFEAYLETAPTLPTQPSMSADERLWQAVGERTQIDGLRWRLRWPPAAIERRLSAWQAEGRVRIETCPLVGYVVSRAA